MILGAAFAPTVSTKDLGRGSPGSEAPLAVSTCPLEVVSGLVSGTYSTSGTRIG